MIHLGMFRYHAAEAMHSFRVARRVDAKEAAASSGGSQHAAEQLDGRGLSRAVWPQKPEDFTLFQPEADRIDGLFAIIVCF